MPENNMVNGQVLPVGVTDRKLMAAMLAVPRRNFVPASMSSIGHIDTDLQIRASTGASPSRFLMAAGPFARLLQAARIGSTDTVLDIGCATGYSSAVIARLAGFVTALECDQELAAVATRNLANLDIDNAAVVVGPLEIGWPAGGPYDVIFVGGSVEKIPDVLVPQLRQGGRVLAIMDDGVSSSAHLFVKSSSALSGHKLFDASTKNLPGFLTTEAFVF